MLNAKIVRYGQEYKVLVRPPGLFCGGWMCVKIAENMEDAEEMLDEYAETQAIKPELMGEYLIRDDGKVWQECGGGV